MEWIGIAALVISLIAVFVEMYLSRSRYKEIKRTQDRILDYLHREFDAKIEADTKFDAPEMTVKIGKRPAEKPTFRLTFRRWLGKLFP